MLMTTVELPRAPQPLVLQGVPWEVYEELRKLPENNHVRMTFDEGVLEMMTPSARHERWSEILGQLITVWAMELAVDMTSCRSMTVSRKDLQKGLEPDNCYYVQHELQVRGKAELDFAVDPPPDLAIEVDVSRSSLGKLKLYAAFGVPEVWRYDGQSIEVLTLGPKKRYRPSAKSRCLPGIPLDEMTRVLGRMNTESETALILSFRDYLRRGIQGGQLS
jgi:Uma2 family endonuclease